MNHMDLAQAVHVAGEAGWSLRDVTEVFVSFVGPGELPVPYRTAWEVFYQFHLSDEEEVQRVVYVGVRSKAVIVRVVSEEEMQRERDVMSFPRGRVERSGG